ncbi:hypothetical protein ZEAMMB73_Zm00001d004328 [Zea mays]|jgi:hypothetical protein|uniref:Uncharacterized protein n=1 Tax=Zea mays TaxID=4577 RepID=A0A1D6EEU1_MAIZE|nr:hypothetical protein ZEAMMB73_Zm00001d004328 [Zea mays]
MKACTILMALCLVVFVSSNVVEGGAYMRHEALSRKGLKQQRKLATSGLNPSVSNLSGQTSSSVNNVVNNNYESTNTNMSDAATATTPMTATTTDSHHDLSVDQYRRITHNSEGAFECTRTNS